MIIVESYSFQLPAGLFMLVEKTPIMTMFQFSQVLTGIPEYLATIGTWKLI